MKKKIEWSKLNRYANFEWWIQEIVSFQTFHFVLKFLHARSSITNNFMKKAITERKKIDNQTSRNFFQRAKSGRQPPRKVRSCPCPRRQWRPWGVSRGTTPPLAPSSTRQPKRQKLLLVRRQRLTQANWTVWMLRKGLQKVVLIIFTILNMLITGVYPSTGTPCVGGPVAFHG